MAAIQRIQNIALTIAHVCTMPHYPCIQPISLGSSERRKKNALRKCHARGGDAFAMRHAPQPPSYYQIRKHRYRKLRIGQHITYTYRLCDLAAIWGLHVNTVTRWYNQNMLPKPFYYSYRKYRTWGWEHVPYFITEQVHIIIRVLNDVFAQSSQFRRSYQAHIEMMQRGDAMVRSRIPYKAVKRISKPPEPNTPHERSALPSLFQSRAARQQHNSGENLR